VTRKGADRGESLLLSLKNCGSEADRLSCTPEKISRNSREGGNFSKSVVHLGSSVHGKTNGTF